MHYLQSSGCCQPDPQRIKDRQTLFPLQPIGDGPAISVLQNQIGFSPLLFDHIVDSDHMLVADAGDGPRFVQEAFDALRILGPTGTQMFDGHPAAQLPVLGQVDVPPASPPQVLQYFVTVLQQATNRQAHRFAPRIQGNRTTNLERINEWV